MMMSKPAIQTLKWVACLFILGGLVSVVNVVQDALAGKISLNLNVLSILVGIGLLRLNSKSHTWGLVIAGFWTVGAGFLAVLSLGTIVGLKAHLNITSFTGQPTVGVLTGVLVSALAFWAYSVLDREDVRQLFGK